MLCFKFKQPMQSTILPVQLEITEYSKKSKQETREYVKKYKNKIGITGKWYISTKLKGPRVIWNGKQILNKHLYPIPNVPTWFIALLPKNVCLDGVLQNFHETKPNQWKEIIFMVFDMPVHNVVFESRLGKLKKMYEGLFNVNQKKHIRIHEFEFIPDIQKEFKHVNNRYVEEIEKGGRGIMLIQASSKYKGEIVNHLLEYKKEYIGKATIIGLLEGVKQYYRYLGKFKCKTDQGKVFYCSKDIPDDIRKKYHFKFKECMFIEKDVPQINDILTYTSTIMIKNGTVPRDAIYKAFEKADPSLH